MGRRLFPQPASGCATAITAPATSGSGIRLAFRACATCLLTVPTDCGPHGKWILSLVLVPLNGGQGREGVISAIE